MHNDLGSGSVEPGNQLDHRVSSRPGPGNSLLRYGSGSDCGDHRHRRVRWKPDRDRHRAVVFGVPGETAFGDLGDGLSSGHPAHRRDQPGDMRSGARHADVAQACLVFGGRNSSQFPNLRPRQQTAGERGRNDGQVWQDPSDPQALGRRGVPQPALPAEPLLSVAALPCRPGLAPVELAEHLDDAGHTRRLPRRVRHQLCFQKFGRNPAQIHVPIIAKGCATVALAPATDFSAENRQHQSDAWAVRCGCGAPWVAYGCCPWCDGHDHGVLHQLRPRRVPRMAWSRRSSTSWPPARSCCFPGVGQGPATR